MPLSLAFFVLTAIVYLLQLFPYTGVFLMILAAPLWSVVTINAGFAFLTVETIGGRVSRLWLAAPILWFGGYFVAAALNHQAFNALAEKVTRQNAGKTMP